MTASDLETVVRRARNADGGWGYSAGRTSRLEPTCWAALALGTATTLDSATTDCLHSWPTRDGLLLERAGGDVNYAFHALALLVLLDLRVEHALGNVALLDGLQRGKAVTFGPSHINRQDNSLQGWSWTAGTFSWVEPTACGLLALKQWARRRRDGIVDATRVDQAHRLLVDRVCREGGWNYGNSNMLGAELRPYVPTTALGLLAMRDHPDDPAIVRSASWLEAHAVSEPSGMALALTCLALRAYGRATEVARGALMEQLPVTLDLGTLSSIAAALYVLGDHHDATAFAL